MPTMIVDDHGRITLPKEILRALGVEPGDKLEYCFDEPTLTLTSARLNAALDELIAEAIEAEQTGQTISAEDLAAEFGVSLDA